MLNGLNPIGTTEFRKEISAPETKTVLKAEQGQAKDQVAVYDVFELEKREDNSICHDGIIYTSSANLVDHLKEEEKDPAWKECLTSMAEQADEGLPLSEIVENAGCFPVYVRGILSVGETAGRLEESLQALKKYR